MLTVVLLLLLCLLVAVGVVGTVLAGAQRESRDLLTVRGDDVLTGLRSTARATAATAGELAIRGLARVRTLAAARRP